MSISIPAKQLRWPSAASQLYYPLIGFLLFALANHRLKVVSDDFVHFAQDIFMANTLFSFGVLLLTGRIRLESASTPTAQLSRSIGCFVFAAVFIMFRIITL